MATLILVASKHGSTLEIAEALARELRDATHAVDISTFESAPDLSAYDCLVLGSAIYMGRWMPEADRFIELNAAALQRVAVWLFSSGPLGEDPPRPQGDPPQLADLLKRTSARGHHNFTGRLDSKELGWAERLVVRTVGAPEGDFRDWEDIRGWAQAIAREVHAPQANAH